MHFYLEIAIQEVRQETQEELNSLETEVKQTEFPEFDAREFKSGDTLYKVLAEKFEEAPKIFRMLKLLTEHGLNVNLFFVGDKVSLKGGNFLVERAKGENEEYSIYEQPNIEPVSNENPKTVLVSETEPISKPELSLPEEDVVGTVSDGYPDPEKIVFHSKYHEDERRLFSSFFKAERLTVDNINEDLKAFFDFAGENISDPDKKALQNALQVKIESYS